ncbi:hypothetical protein BATDEDRAFT_33126 [Batrachochytrium dendrobatidis JAM81]|uniref:Phosphoserine aminotransferase n=1 Tax=Batrachochytrium dendrobatidis (strain JAM81 / FGSC 10211) TaxID=684364 RepID=F4P0P4_BATDJ|nr:O-phospho-L-serine:2-oxoglutarate transaminase [Batrachochytrium dendrobatidis JAM81]EGF81629.1 hypothetical protein BATDEDRAFT_33126 [Batrachochytrium dendrobatidis JAM81]|eukprot:XP_006677978.1 hypothetical protein BATDEDRAFT_33126 [Batrachochytrium dendrobatidis JAM81]
MTHPTAKTVFNFGAGPAVLPQQVLYRVQNEFLNYGNTGCSLMELSHRSSEFEQLINKASSDLCTLLSIPDSYQVMFMQGGGSTQFSAVVYNLAGCLQKPVDYIVTGVWSGKAAQEAQRLGVQVNIVISTAATGHDGSMTFSGSDAAYIYYCDNETVNGVELAADFVDHLPVECRQVPVVCDMSSNILSRPFDITKYGLVFGGAQKNIGPAGVTVVVIRKDLLIDNSRRGSLGRGVVMPTMLDYKVCAENNSLYNTPPTFAIYVSGLVFEWVMAAGGVSAMAEASNRKSKLLYDTIAKLDKFYRCAVKPGVRSRMNVPFRIIRNGQPAPDLEKQFIIESEEQGMMQLKGHRSVGGIRASMYNALSIDAVECLVAFMQNFAAQHS